MQAAAFQNFKIPTNAHKNHIECVQTAHTSSAIFVGQGAEMDKWT